MKTHIFIGYDEREKDPYNVCVQSLKDSSLCPENIIVHPINHRELRKLGYFDRPWLIKEDGTYEDVRDGRPFSVQFSHSRFLTPFLAKKYGISDCVMFVDCDFLFLDDVNVLMNECRRQAYLSNYPVQVVKHDYNPQNTVKMDGSRQTTYNRKLWSSLMVFDTTNKANDVLDPQSVSYQTGKWLHQFEWLDNPETQIGSIPEVWNFIPNHSERRTDLTGSEASAIHFTEGGPWFENYEDCPYSELWTRSFYRSMRAGFPR